MDAPRFDRASVPVEKLIDYLLAADHPEGGAKARFFLACGFTADAPDVLAEALRRHAERGEARAVRTAFGVKWVVEGAIVCPDGRDRRLRSVWIVEPDQGAPRFVTAYPREALRGVP